MRSWGFLSLFAMPLLLSACVDPNDGVCKSAGNVDTHQVTGQWKKVKGYSGSQPTNEELDYNFDLLVIEPGDRTCEGSVVNKRKPLTSNWKGSYSLNLKTKSITIAQDTSDGAGTGTPTSAKYSFAGSCGQTEMKMLFDDGSQETYRIYNTVAAVGSCDPAQEQ